MVRTPERTLTEFLRESDIGCPQCGYALRGLRDPACPECGFGFDIEALRALVYHRPRSLVFIDWCLESIWAWLLVFAANMAMIFGTLVHPLMLALLLPTILVALAWRMSLEHADWGDPMAMYARRLGALTWSLSGANAALLWTSIRLFGL